MKFFKQWRGNCVAVYGERINSTGVAIYNCHSSSNAPNSSFCYNDTVSELYLKDHCEEVTEEKVREIHPKLIDFIKQEVKFQSMI